MWIRGSVRVSGGHPHTNMEHLNLENFFLNYVLLETAQFRINMEVV